MDSDIDDSTSNKYPRKYGRSLPSYVYGDGKNVQGSGRQAQASEVRRGRSHTRGKRNGLVVSNTFLPLISLTGYIED